MSLIFLTPLDITMAFYLFLITFNLSPSYLCLHFIFSGKRKPFDIKVQLVIIFAIPPCTLGPEKETACIRA